MIRIPRLFLIGRLVFMKISVLILSPAINLIKIVCKHLRNLQPAITMIHRAYLGQINYNFQQLTHLYRYISLNAWMHVLHWLIRISLPIIIAILHVIATVEEDVINLEVAEEEEVTTLLKILLFWHSKLFYYSLLVFLR